MLRFLGGAGSALLLVLAGFLIWQSRASQETAIPPAPPGQAAEQGATGPVMPMRLVQQHCSARRRVECAGLLRCGRSGCWRCLPGAMRSALIWLGKNMAHRAGCFGCWAIA